MFKHFSTVWLLAAINAIAMSAVPMMVLIGSLIGAELSPSEKWATLPIASMVVGTALGVLPATHCMQRWGRRAGLALFITVGVGACLLMAQAIAWQSFALFCSGSLMLGTTAAALQQIRFAAMESVALDQAPTAASLIMCAGIFAAILGPELALWGKNLSQVTYQASYWLGAACLFAAGTLLVFYHPPALVAPSKESVGRPLRLMIKNPGLLLAIISGVSAFMVMSFLMTATPISMHLHHGHSLEDAKWVIQSHIIAMFLPSLATAWLFRLLGIRGLMLAGLACYTLMIVIGLSNASVLGFWGQLVLLGVGWNFLFVASTALLPSTYEEGEQFRAQALNDTTIFCSQAVASLSAGAAVTLMSWQAMSLLCLAPIAVMLALLLRPQPAVLVSTPAE